MLDSFGCRQIGFHQVTLLFQLVDNDQLDHDYRWAELKIAAKGVFSVCVCVCVSQ